MKTNYPNSLTIQQYLNGTLDSKSMHALEKQALEDHFLFEALEGYANTKSSNPGHGLSILQRQLHERIMHLQENKKVYDFSWQRLSVAAAAAVMFITTGILFWMNSPKHNPKVANNSKQIEAPLTYDTLNRDTSEIPQSAIVLAKRSKEDLLVVNSKPEVHTQVAASKMKQPLVDISDSEDAVVGVSANSGFVNQEKVAASNLAEAEVVPKQERDNDIDKSDSPTIYARRKSLVEAKTSAYSQADENELHPVLGWNYYREYLKKSTNLSKNEPDIKGMVVVGFVVEPNGMLTKLHIIKGLTDSRNAEAIRLVKEGPAWKPASNGKALEAQVEVEFGAK